MSSCVDLHADDDRLERQRLRRCLNELVGVLSLPALWSTHEPAVIRDTLLDVLTRMHRLDFAYIRAGTALGSAAGESARFGRAFAGTSVAELGRALEPYLNESQSTVVRGLPGGPDRDIFISVFPLGFAQPVATFVAASFRVDFPTTFERLVLQTATNQAAFALMESQRTSLEQREAAERLEHRERELRLLVDFVPHLIGAVGPDGRMLFMNRAATAYLGTPVEDAIEAERWRARFYHPDDREAMQRSVQRALAEGAPQESEARIRRYDGEYRWFQVRHEVLLDHRGGLIRLYAAATDIHDRKLAEARVRRENLALREELARTSMSEQIIGCSEPLRAVLSQIGQVTATESTVLITGETGTGKELVARAIHRGSRRAAGPFVTVNCAALPPSLLASELFGHEKGAFTGALQSRLGRFEVADGGTLFLDEVGELSPEAQVMLLRVLQEREFERVGGTRPIRTDVRLVAATNKNLAEASARNLFRADLYYRLNVFPIEMPPLRARRGDIPLLVEHFSSRIARRMGKRVSGIDGDTLRRLENHHWPGNVRELENIVERAIIVCESGVLNVPTHWLSAPESDRENWPNGSAAHAAPERELIESALRASQGRVAGPFGAAKRLRMAASTLESKIKAMAIDKRQFRSS